MIVIARGRQWLLLHLELVSESLLQSSNHIQTLPCLLTGLYMNYLVAQLSWLSCGLYFLNSCDYAWTETIGIPVNIAGGRRRRPLHLKLVIKCLLQAGNHEVQVLPHEAASLALSWISLWSNLITFPRCDLWRMLRFSWDQVWFWALSLKCVG